MPLSAASDQTSFRWAFSIFEQSANLWTNQTLFWISYSCGSIVLSAVVVVLLFIWSVFPLFFCFLVFLFKQNKKESGKLNGTKSMERLNSCANDTRINVSWSSIMLPSRLFHYSICVCVYVSVSKERRCLYPCCWRSDAYVWVGIHSSTHVYTHQPTCATAIGLVFLHQRLGFVYKWGPMREVRGITAIDSAWQFKVKEFTIAMHSFIHQIHALLWNFMLNHVFIHRFRAFKL